MSEEQIKGSENGADPAPVHREVLPFRWPRGKYNGQRIMGVSFQFKFTLQGFEWKPRWVRYANCFRWLWFFVWINWAYEDR
jgi:hypothetical protein